MTEKPIDKIRELSTIQMEIFDIIDRLAEYDVNLACQNLRDAALNVSTGMGKLATAYGEAKEDEKKDKSI